MEDVVVIEHCKDCDKHKWCTNHDEKKYKDIYEKTRSQIENECPEVTVLENQDHPSIQGIITQKTDRTPFAKLSFPKTGSFEVYFRGKIIFSKLKHGIWPHPAMVAKNIRDIIDGNIEVKATPQTTGFKEYQSKPEVPKRPKAAAVDKQETAEKKTASADNFAKNNSPGQQKAQNKPEERKADPPKPQVEEKKVNEVNQGKTVEVSKEKKEEGKEVKAQSDGVKAPEGLKAGEEAKKQEEVKKPQEVMKKSEDGIKTHVEPVKATVEVAKHEETTKAHVEPPKAPAETNKHEEPPKAAVEPPKHHEEPPKAAVEPPKHHEEPPKAAVEPPKHHEEPPKAAVEPPKHHEEPPKAHVEPPKHHEEPPKHHEEPPKHHDEPAKHPEAPAKHPEEPPKHHEEPAKHPEEPAKHHEEPPKHHEEPPKHHEEPPKHHEEPAHHNEEPPKHHPVTEHKHEEPAKPHEEVPKAKPAAKAEEVEENYEEDEDMQESNSEAPYAVTETFNLPLAIGEGKNSKITLKNPKASQQVFHIQVKNSSLIKVSQTEYTIEPGVPQKLKLEILPQTKAGVYRGYIIVESEHEVVACNEIVVEVN